MRRTPRRPFVRREEAAQHKINQKITATEVRLILEGREPIVISTLKAIDMAAEEGFDLVIMDEAHMVKNPKANRTKIMNQITEKTDMQGRTAVHPKGKDTGISAGPDSRLLS